MMPPTSPRKRRVPQPLRGQRGPLVAAYVRAYRGSIGQHGWPEQGSRFESAMKRAALSEGHLELARKAWVALFGRQRHTDKTRGDLRAAEKAMGRADEALSR